MIYRLSHHPLLIFEWPWRGGGRTQSLALICITFIALDNSANAPPALHNIRPRVEPVKLSPNPTSLSSGASKSSKATQFITSVAVSSPGSYLNLLGLKNLNRKENRSRRVSGSFSFPALLHNLATEHLCAHLEAKPRGTRQLEFERL